MKNTIRAFSLFIACAVNNVGIASTVPVAIAAARPQDILKQDMSALAAKWRSLLGANEAETTELVETLIAWSARQGASGRQAIATGNAEKPGLVHFVRDRKAWTYGDPATWNHVSDCNQRDKFFPEIIAKMSSEEREAGLRDLVNKVAYENARKSDIQFQALSIAEVIVKQDSPSFDAFVVVGDVCSVVESNNQEVLQALKDGKYVVVPFLSKAKTRLSRGIYSELPALVINGVQADIEKVAQAYRNVQSFD